MKIPGRLKVGHHFITDECRQTHGDEGAFSEAVNRLKIQYLKCYKVWPKGTKFHLVMSIEDAEKEKGDGE